MTTDWIEARVRSLLAGHLGRTVQEIVPDARIREDLGADSLDLMELVQRLEEELDTVVDEKRAAGLQTVGDVVAYAIDLKQRDGRR